MICTLPARTRRSSSARRVPAKAISARNRSTSTSARCRCVRDLVLAETGVPFFVGFNRRFDPSHRAPRRCDSQRRHRAPGNARPVEPGPRDLPAGLCCRDAVRIFYDTMIHDFDMVRWCWRRSRSRITARTACMLDAKDNPHGDPDLAMVMLTMASGALVHVNSSFRAVYGYDSDRSVRLRRDADLAQPHRPPSNAMMRPACGRIRCCASSSSATRSRTGGEFDDFVRAIGAKQAPSHRASRRAAALEIAEAAAASAKAGTTVALR
jgi:myo-inositol 2-dehydrogenase/D-chiro-inositol 1-dehydrogenase